MVCTTVMEWLRTPLTIFRQAAWVETCCYALKVWYFQSRVRSTSYCLTVNSFEIFFPVSTFCPTVAEDSHPRTAVDFKVSGISKDAPRCSCFSLIISASLMNASSLTAPSLLLIHGRRRFVSTPVASCVLAGHYRIHAGCCSHLHKPWLLASISWVVYCIDVFLPQVVTLGKNSRGYHYILANLVSNNRAPPLGVSGTCFLLHVMGLSLSHEHKCACKIGGLNVFAWIQKKQTSICFVFRLYCLCRARYVSCSSITIWQSDCIFNSVNIFIFSNTLMS